LELEGVARVQYELIREHFRSGWGCLLIFREDLKALYQGGLLLDIGSDVGFLSGMVGEDSYVGVDIVNVKEAYGVSPKYFVQSDAHSLPFRDEGFDFVSLVEALEHLPDPFCCLKEVKRVLKKGGRMFIQSVEGSDPCAENDPTHYQSFHRWSLERVLRCLFTNVQVEKRGGTLIAKVIKDT